MPSPAFLRLAPATAGVVLLFAHAPAAAQATGSCGQTAALTETLEPALSAGFEPIRRFLQIRRSEPRYVEFTLDGPQAVTLRTEAPTTDPAMALYDERGQVVAWDDDGGGGTDALVASDLDAGRYCVQVRPIGAAPVDFSELVLVLESGFLLPPGEEPPCGGAGTLDLAAGLASPMDAIAVDGETEGESGRRDYRLSLAEALGLTIDLASGEFDTVLEVYDAAGVQVAGNDDFSGTDSRIEQSFAAGDYCVVARGFGGEGGRFTMAVAEADIMAPLPPCGDPSRTGVLATDFGPAAEPVIAQGTVDPDLLESWFLLNVTESADLQFDARSGEIDTVLQLHDASGALLAENDDGTDGTNSRIDTALSPGDYCLTVRGFGDTWGAFDLSVVPAGMAPPLPGTEPVDPATAMNVEDMGVLENEVRSYTISSDPTLWASFAVTQPGPVAVQGISVSSAFSLSLFAEDGTELGAAGPVEPMSAATISVDLPPGSYRVALSNIGAFGTILRQITVTRE
jgi:hypothetical protein